MDKQTILLYIILGVIAIALGLLFAIIDTKYYTAKCEKIVSDVNQYYEATQDCYMILEWPVMYQIVVSFAYTLIVLFCLAFLVILRRIFFEELF